MVPQHKSFRFFAILVSLFRLNNSNAIIEEKEYQTFPLGLTSRLNETYFVTDNYPIHVKISAYISKVYEVNEVNMEMKTHLLLQMSWRDQRLDEKNFYFKGTPDSYLKYVKLTDVYKIWVPDIFLPDEKGSGTATTNTKTDTILFPNGTVVHQIRIPELITACPMNLEIFPFDKQCCQLRIIARTSNMHQVLLFWRSLNPVMISDKIFIPFYTIAKAHPVMLSSRISTGESSALGLNIYFKRVFHYYFWKFYLPVIVIVLITWIPFSLYDACVLRIVILLSTAIFTGWYYLTNSDQLQVSYTTRNDVWRIVNFIFIFIASAESIFVIYFLKTESRIVKYSANLQGKVEQLDVEVAKVKSNFKIVFVGMPTRMMKLDKIFQLYVPVFYCTFIFAFWQSERNDIR